MKPLSQTLPDRTSKFGRGWRIDLPAIRRAKNTQEGDDASVCAWVVQAPWAHPVWSTYLIMTIHLRPIPRLKEPKILLEGATHEVFVIALHPDHEVDLEDPMQHHLTPFNFVGQWRAGTDYEAERKIEHTVDEILAGNLSPDTDYVRMWVERFSGSNLKEPAISCPRR